MSEKTRYTDEELQEFKELILQKLDKAQRDYELLKANVMNSDGNDTADTSPTFKVLEEGCEHSQQGGGRSARTTSDEIYPASAGCSCKNREQDLWYLPSDRQTDST